MAVYILTKTCWINRISIEMWELNPFQFDASCTWCLKTLLPRSRLDPRQRFRDNCSSLILVPCKMNYRVEIEQKICFCDRKETWTPGNVCFCWSAAGLWGRKLKMSNQKTNRKCLQTSSRIFVTQLSQARNILNLPQRVAASVSTGKLDLPTSSAVGFLLNSRVEMTWIWGVIWLHKPR